MSHSATFSCGLLLLEAQHDRCLRSFPRKVFSRSDGLFNLLPRVKKSSHLEDQHTQEAPPLLHTAFHHPGRDLDEKPELLSGRLGQGSPALTFQAEHINKLSGSQEANKPDQERWVQTWWRGSCSWWHRLRRRNRSNPNLAIVHTQNLEENRRER